MIAGKAIDPQCSQSRFAFARNSPTIASGAFKQALAVAGVTADTPATVLSDGDAGLWRLQREALPNATVVLDWWHAAVRFEHALQAARGLRAADAHLAAEAVRGLERAKWRLWHGRWPGCRRKLAALCRWARPSCWPTSKQALAVAGVTADTPATVLSDGDAGLWRLQREALPNATIVLDWWHVAVRFEHALQAARGLGAADAHLAAEAVRGLERAK